MAECKYCGETKEERDAMLDGWYKSYLPIGHEWICWKCYDRLNDVAFDRLKEQEEYNVESDD